MDYRLAVATQPETPSWRQGFDTVERQVSPVLEGLVQSESFAVAMGLAARARRAMEDQASRSTRRVLHALNLPAGTDVTRILNELGQLKRQVRDLSAQLDEAQAELQQARASTPRKRAAGGR
jgi:hypothetical protein